MNKKLTDVTFSTEGIDVSAVEYQLDEKTINNIREAKTTLDKHPNFKLIIVDGDKVDTTIVQYDSMADDDDKVELKRGDTFHFRTDVHHIIVEQGGGIWFRGYGKWNSADYYEFEIEL